MRVSSDCTKCGRPECEADLGGLHGLDPIPIGQDPSLALDPPHFGPRDEDRVVTPREQDWHRPQVQPGRLAADDDRSVVPDPATEHAVAQPHLRGRKRTTQRIVGCQRLPAAGSRDQVDDPDS